MTYIFDVNSKYPFYIKTAYVLGAQNLYTGASNQGTQDGRMILTVDDTTPAVLFYFAEGNENAIGQIVVKTLAEDTLLDIDNTVIGKKTYTSGNGVVFSNGMKIHFVGNVTPATYLGKDYIVEGVGNAIVLVEYDSLQTVGISTTNLDVNFDATPFDQYPFDDFSFVPLTPEYITINRAAPDLNSWSRYNRWIHSDVIAATAAANGVDPVYDSSMRAQRPIIEFASGLQLYNFGSQAKSNVDLIDTTTVNAFRTFEGSPGFYIDETLVEQGFRIIFNADTDDLVRGKIYEVNFVIINGKSVVSLVETQDTSPNLNDAVVTIRGNQYAGSNWWFNGNNWVFGQQKTGLNQPPLFEIYDANGVKLSDQTVYDSSFAGTQIFGYSVGTGPSDPVLGFPLSYKNVVNVGDYLFSNYFMTDTFNTFSKSNVTSHTVAGNYLKINATTGEIYKDVWTPTVNQSIPILQFEVIETPKNYIQITSVENPGFANDLTMNLFVNDIKQIRNVDYIVRHEGSQLFIVSETNFSVNDRVLVELFTTHKLSSDGYYDVPENLTNNPLNGPISDFTFTELSDHVNTIVNNNSEFIGVFPGDGNLRDLSNISSYGTRLVSHKNPMSFAHYFLGSKEHNLIDAVRKVSIDYNQFKSNFLRQITNLKTAVAPTAMLDNALNLLNANKDETFSYNYSDMMGYGNNCIVRKYTVSSPLNVQFSLVSSFDSTVLSERAVLVYHNGEILVKDRDYTIDNFNPSITVNVVLSKGDIIEVRDYPSTVGSYIPPTPTKLGLYPKFTPSIYLDDTYAGQPQMVIQGHDGSITLAYGDYRDQVLLEFETRIYNNLKTNYDINLLNIHAVLPGAFRDNEYSFDEVTQILTPDFLKWTGFFGVDFQKNTGFDELNSFTYNYSSNIDSLNKQKLPGYWRGIYKYFYDTDRPHTNPWEMLGFAEKPNWWEGSYGPSPYTNGNLILWEDLEAGRILYGDRAGIDPLYARPGLSKILPVDGSGKLISPTDSFLATTPIVNLNDPHRTVVLRGEQINSPWKFGDQGPAETAWRKSSYWPFICQILMALTKPATYASVMFDPSQGTLNKFNEYKYGPTNSFLNLSNVSLYRDIIDDERVLGSGYSVMVIETGLARDVTYLNGVKTDISNIDYNLMVKLGGFVSKDKLQLTIDAVDPTSPHPGVLVALEDYEIFFNRSTPVLSIGISGIIVQKTNTGYAIRGYDKYSPYFTIFAPFASNSDQAERVGGRSETFVNWIQNTTYDVDQIVFYLDRYYRVKQKHNSDTVFNGIYYQSLPYLPTVGGVAVLRRTAFSSTETIVPYGTEYSTLQEVYDLIVGYGQWLMAQGFVFDTYNNDLNQVLDWKFTAKEFLFWTTQNWAVNSVITLSPFADSLQFNSNIGVVDNVLNSFYEYSLLKADGAPFPKNNFNIIRLDGTFTLSTTNTQEGLFFARINVVQKEHALILNNYTLFNDVVYDIGSGYRQRRINLKGFRTANWNGDFFSPGFIFDQATVVNWEKYADYPISSVVRFAGKYYTAPKSIVGTETFDLGQWLLLDGKPTPQLLPNFEYKINQFEDFYSLDIDNFDAGQQAAAQNLVGYIPRSYLNNIIGDPIAQYKFYQGYIREKGTKNPLAKLSKAGLNQFQSSIDFNEEWAFRIGYYGGFNTYQELEISLESTDFIENPQIIEFVNSKPVDSVDAVYYKSAADIVVSPENFDITQAFPVTVETIGIDDFQLPVAGYPRFDDVTATAYNKNSILDIANNSALQEGNVIWLGFKENGDWDVLRYTKIPTVITGVSILISGQTLQVETQDIHRLAAGDLISISRVMAGVDQCYIVSSIVSPTQFVVNTTLTTLPLLPDSLTGLLFAFKSSRLSSLNNLYTIPFLERWNVGEKVWVDADENNNWAVYEKADNYQPINNYTAISAQPQHYGTAIANSPGSSVFVVSSPDYLDGFNNRGRVFVQSRDPAGNITPLVNYSINDNSVYYQGTGTNAFGSSLIFDAALNMVIAGAPLTSNVNSTTNGVIVSSTTTSTAHVHQGIVKLSLIDTTIQQEIAKTVITTPNPADLAYFGQSLLFSTLTNKLLVSSPGYNSDAGAVYAYTLTVTTSSIGVNIVSTTTTALPSIQFGSNLTGNLSLSRYAVTAPGYSSNVNSAGSTGAIYVYDPLLVSPQIITGDNADLPLSFGAADKFASTIKMTDDGKYLIVGSPTAYDFVRGTPSGLVDIFVWNGTTFVHNQRISAPIISNDTSFGYNISVDTVNGLLAISSLGNGKTKVPTFDKYSERLDNTTAFNTYGSIYVNDSTSAQRNSSTTFDSGASSFHDTITDAGSVHAYTLYGTYWAYAQEITDVNIASGSQFGSSLSVVDNSIYIGAPALNNGYNSGKGQIFIFDKSDLTSNGWNIVRFQEPLVDLSLIKRAITIDTTTEQIQNYIDIIDPVKGNLLGTAKEELKYTTSYDPAIYSIGISGVNINSNSSWLDGHLGELWWDLSTVKYVWYEQGELEYRKNNWNNIFPGSSIDVYEWVRSEYLPSEWSQLADTADGLTRGISGQPKFADNTVMSVKQIYNSISNAFTNVYYYWVKNKAIVPTNVSNRRAAAYQVAQEIANPVASGNQFIAILGPTSAMLANSNASIATDQINLNIAFDFITDAANRHTEWLLLQENDPNSKPNWLLEKKLIDSILGHDNLGNPVPDPTLPKKLSYGVEIRPRQSLFVNRFEALHNIVEFANEVLIDKLITGQVDFTNLEMKDQIPSTSTYDVLVEDIYGLELIPTLLLTTAELIAVPNSDGKISDVTIKNPGFGYLTPPTITVLGDGIGAEFSTEINAQGQITSVNIINEGSGYSEIDLMVRPFTAVIQTDSTIGGKWSINQWNSMQSTWIKIQTQDFDTTLYWKYVDWMSPDFDPLATIISTVPSLYVLNVLITVPAGSYVKVLNGGDGRYLILCKTDGNGGTFDDNWNLVYSQNGTIQFLDLLWNQAGSFYAWDEYAGWDQTEFDQSPDKEILYVLTALQENLFVGDLKVYWNQLFFKAVRYAMSEQKTLDWAFKTTFISATNSLGSLDQRHTYKLQNSQNYEDFLNEIKPYHTKIRRFTEEYTSTELTKTFTTDFDLPIYYNTVTNNFSKVEFGNTMLLEYPWKSWKDNYTFGIDSIEMYDVGSGYTEVPTVNIIAAPGDTGHGATAVAFISLGTVNRILVTNPGIGYTENPTIVLNGGGSVTRIARAYPRFARSNIRTTNLTMKFDRISGVREIGTQFVTDQFVADGEQDVFNLSWVPVPEKSLITLTINGVLQLVDSYTISFTESAYNPQPNTVYTKKYAKLSLISIPNRSDVIEINYPKDLSLYTAVDRIEDYYNPGSGMPGVDPTQLMSGLEYPGLIVDTVPFALSGGWDTTGYGISTWDSYATEDGYTAFSTTSRSTQTFTLTNLISTGTEVNIYINGQKIDGTATSLVSTLIGKGTASLAGMQVLAGGSGYDPSQVLVYISAPDDINGVQAVATATVVSGVITAVTLVPGYEGSGYASQPIVSISGVNTTQAYAQAILKAEFTTTTSSTVATNIVIPAVAFTSSNSLVVFRYSTSDGTLQLTNSNSLDSIIDGGDLAYTTALGLSPSEIIMDGGSTSTQFITGMIDDGFLNTYNSTAPEECVPGQIQEAVAISVYTEPQTLPPIISSKKYFINGSTSTFALGIVPSSNDSMFAIFNDRVVSTSTYSINYSTNSVTFTTLPGTGWLSLTSMQLGALSLLEYNINTVTTTNTTFVSVGSYNDFTNTNVSDYVTINGIPGIYGVDYTVTNYVSRMEFTYYQTGTIQTYLFNGPAKSFSQVVEQVIQVFDVETILNLEQPPGNLGPFHSQVIVSKNGARLNPPVTTYYQVTNGQLVFDISQSIIYPLRSVDIASLEVYVNGVQAPIPGIWRLNQADNQVAFSNGTINNGDVIAIVVLRNYDYLIKNNQLVLNTPSVPYDQYSITTFTNHDSDFIRSERFKGHATNRYRMQRQILDSSYVWVSYNGASLIADLDYRVEVDGYTIVLRPGLYINGNDDVVITSFAGSTAKPIGFRMFKDLLGRTHFKRLSKENTAILVQPLYSTSTSIIVSDGSVLTPPVVSLNRPGVVLIDSERIEFFTINGNQLGQLRRGTLGTSINDVYVSGTSVIDQGSDQTIPVIETVEIFTTATVNTTSHYPITGITFNPTAAFTDQVEVRYQGRLLLKPGLITVVHDADLAFDSTSTADTIMQPEFTIDSTSSVLTLSFTPESGAKLEVIKRNGVTWYQVNSGKTLSENNTPPAKFLLEGAAALPDKYRYVQ